MNIRLEAVAYLTAAYTAVESAIAFLVLSAFRSAKDGLADGDGYILLGMIAVALVCAVRESSNQPDSE